MRSPTLAREHIMEPSGWPGLDEELRRRRIFRVALATAAVLHVAMFAVHWPAMDDGLPESPDLPPPIFVLQQVRFQQPPPPALDLPRPPARRVPIPDATPDDPEILVERPVEIASTRDRDWVVGVPSEIPAPPPPPAPQVYEVGFNIAPPRLLHRVEPVYTRAALAARVQGVVILEAIIDTEGSVASITVLRGLKLGLTESAVEAVRQWRFEPSTVEGRAVPVVYRLTVVFQIR